MAKRWEAFGKNLTVAEWANEPECATSVKNLRHRLAAGWSVEDALTTPTVEVTWEAYGETKSLTAWVVDPRCVVDEKTLRSRHRSGWEAERAISTPRRKPANIHEAFGEFKTLQEWSLDSRCKVPRTTLHTRLSSGQPLEEALTVPPVQPKTYSHSGTSKTLHTLATEFDLAPPTLHKRLEVIGMSLDDAISIPVGSQKSFKESLLAEFISTLTPDAVYNDRTVLAHKEIDIFLPEQKIGVEFNGLYWHSELHRTRNYHAEKVKAAKDAGIQLIQIWEDDWLYKRPQVERMLKRKLGVSSEKTVNARECYPTTISPIASLDFLNEHHVQGGTNASVHLALQTKDGEVVAVAAFQRRKNHGNVYYELVRFVTSCIVRGGFSKLVTHFRRSVPDMSLVSFANLEVSDGSLYETNGWELDTVLRPDYMYVVNGRREHKFNYRKARFRKDPNLKFEEGMTEQELATLNGLYRVYDSGKLRFVLPASK